MANRCYLYAVDRSPSDGKTYPRGLCEYSWDVPIVHKLMMGGDPRRVKSAIWDPEIGILADRDGAIERVEAFAAALLAGHTGKAAGDLREQLDEMRAVLKKTPATPYLLLEVGEIVDMMGGDLVKNVDKVIADIPVVVAKAARADAKWLGKLRKTALDEFNFGYWSDTLYFSFTQPKKKPPAKKPTTKKPAAKAKAR